MAQPLVSIVTPSLNQGDFIRATIESVQRQTYPHIEHIIVDGGSQDDSVNVIKEYDGRLEWVSEPDDGQSDAINKGWRMSRGDIVTWLNSDDLLATPHVIGHVADAFLSHPHVDAFCGDYEVVGVQGEHLFTRKQAPFNQYLLRYANNFIVPSAFFRRQLLDSVGYLDVSLRWAMDLDYWIRALDAGAKFKTLPIPMWCHRFHPSSSTVGGIGEMEAEFRAIQQQHQPRWLKGSANSRGVAARLIAGTLRAWTQGQKLIVRGHIDNLPYSYYVRRHYSPPSQSDAQ